MDSVGSTHIDFGPTSPRGLQVPLPFDFETCLGDQRVRSLERLVIVAWKSPMGKS